MDIKFPVQEPEFRGWNLTVGFAASVDGRETDCAVSAEALEDHFGAKSSSQTDLLSAFNIHRKKIEDVARHLLEDEECRHLLLRSGHFRFDAAQQSGTSRGAGT